jgi:uncharacterized ParB-like nuclease family protein
MYFLQKKME